MALIFLEVVDYLSFLPFQVASFSFCEF